jgi:hypothetical protein
VEINETLLNELLNTLAQNGKMTSFHLSEQLQYPLQEVIHALTDLEKKMA